MKHSRTLVQCAGCRHYLGQAPDEPYCAHPKFGTSGFYDIPFDECYTPTKRQQQDKPAKSTSKSK